MPARKLDHRAYAIQDASPDLPPAHPFERAMWSMRFCKEEGTTNEAIVNYAGEIYAEPVQRDILEAWILSNADNETIHKWLKIPPGVVDAYRHLFFDVSVFRDELDIISWVRKLEASRAPGDFGAQLFKNAMMSGTDYLVWMFSRGECELDPHKVTHSIMADAFFRGRSNREHRISSKEAKAAHDFLHTAFATAQQLTKRGAPNLNQLAMKLQYRDETTPVEQAVENKEDILH